MQGSESPEIRREDPRLRASRYAEKRLLGSSEEPTLPPSEEPQRGFRVQAPDRPRSGHPKGHQYDPQDPDGVPRESEAATPPGVPSTRAEVDLARVANTAIDRAIAAGSFDDLAYAGKPLPDVVFSTDPEWWTKSLMQREEVHAAQGLGPEALLLRVVDAGLQDELDALRQEQAVREALEAFNLRVIEARRQLLGGPPVITALREIEQEVTAWKSRAEDRAAARAAAHASQQPDDGHSPARARRLGAWFRRER